VKEGTPKRKTHGKTQRNVFLKQKFITKAQIAYQTDTQVNLNLTLPRKIALALRNANLNNLFMKKYASCKFLCSMTCCIGKIFFTRQEKKKNKINL